VSSTVDRRRNRICSGWSPPFSLSFSPSPPPFVSAVLLRVSRAVDGGGGGGGGGSRDPRAVRSTRAARLRDFATPDEIRLDIAANERREQQPPLPCLSLSLYLTPALQIRAGSAGRRVTDVALDLFDSPNFH